METDKQKIKSIEIWVTNHEKASKPYLATALKYLNDLLEHIEDFRMLEKQSEIEQSRELIRKQYEARLKTQKGIMPYLIHVPVTWILKSLWLRIFG